MKAMTGASSLLVLTPGQTQTGGLLPPLHCIKPIIPHHGLFSVTACVLCTLASKKKKKKNAANEVSATAVETVNMFFSSSPYKRMKKMRVAVRKFNSKEPATPRGLHCQKKREI